MTNVGLWVQLEAKEGKEDEVEAFLENGGALVAQEPGTIAKVRDSHRSNELRDLRRLQRRGGPRSSPFSGAVAAALMEKAGELLSEPPKIMNHDILADKLPSWELLASRV